MNNLDPKAVEAYREHLKTEHEVSAVALFADGFTAGRASAAPTPGPATEAGDTLLVRKLRAAGLDDRAIAAVLAAMESTCPECWDAEAGCRCGDDD